MLLINPPLIFIYLYLSETEIINAASILHYWGFLFFGISWEAALHLFGTDIQQVIIVEELKFVFVASNGPLKASILFMHF